MLKCPPITFLGWDNGAFQRPNTKTQLAPNGAAIHKFPEYFAKKTSKLIAINPPIKPIILSFRLTRKGLFSFVILDLIFVTICY